jgi:hypothetical protein
MQQALIKTFKALLLARRGHMCHVALKDARVS